MARPSTALPVGKSCGLHVGGHALMAIGYDYINRIFLTRNSLGRPSGVSMAAEGSCSTISPAPTSPPTSGSFRLSRCKSVANWLIHMGPSAPFCQQF